MANRNNSNLIRAAAPALLTFLGLVDAADWPNPGNINDVSGGSTPKNTIRAIEANQPYNADQNTMDFTYHIEQRDGNTYFYATLKSRVEVGTSGTQIYNMLGF